MHRYLGSIRFAPLARPGRVLLLCALLALPLAVLAQQPQPEPAQSSPTTSPAAAAPTTPTAAPDAPQAPAQTPDATPPSAPAAQPAVPAAAASPAVLPDRAEIGAITEQELKQTLVGKQFYLRGGYLGDTLNFDEHGRVVGHLAQGSYTLNIVQIDHVRLTTHTV